MNEKRLLAFGEAWNTHDVEEVMRYMAPDCEFRASVGPDLHGRAYRGTDDVRAGIQAFFDRYPGGRFEDSTAFVAGDRGFSAWTFVWNDGTGAEQRVRGCDLFEFDGDLIRVKDAFRKAHA